MKTLIKNGRIVTAVDDYNADILIENERVSVIGKSLDMGLLAEVRDRWAFYRDRRPDAYEGLVKP